MLSAEGIGTLLRVVRSRQFRTRDEQAAHLTAVGGRKFYVQNLKTWETERRLPQAHWYPLLAKGYGIPVSEIHRAVEVSRQYRRMTRAIQQQPLAASEETDVDRRTFMGATALAAGAAAQPWGRLAAALTPSKVNADVMQELSVRTVQLHDLGQHSPSALVMPAVTAHLDHMTALLPQAGRYRRDLAVQLSGTAALAGYTAYDDGDDDNARVYLSVAQDAAEEAGHPALLANIQADRAYGKSPAEARALLVSAQHFTKGPGLATAAAWLASMEAENAAKSGDRQGALLAMERAHTAYDYADPKADQLWVEFFTPARLDSWTVAVYAELGHPDLEETAEGALRKLSGTNGRTDALVMVNTSRAYLIAGNRERAAELARSAGQAYQDDKSRMVGDRLHEVATAFEQHHDPTSTQVAEELRAILV